MYLHLCWLFFIKVSHKGSRKDRQCQYSIDALTEVHKRFLEAARQSAKALLGVDYSPVQAISYSTEPHTRKSLAPPPNTPSEGVPTDWYSPEGQAIIAHDLRRGIPIFWAPQDAIERARVELGAAIAS